MSSAHRGAAAGGAGSRGVPAVFRRLWAGEGTAVVLGEEERWKGDNVHVAESALALWDGEASFILVSKTYGSWAVSRTIKAGVVIYRGLRAHNAHVNEKKRNDKKSAHIDVCLYSEEGEALQLNGTTNVLTKSSHTKLLPRLNEGTCLARVKDPRLSEELNISALEPTGAVLLSVYVAMGETGGGGEGKERRMRGETPATRLTVL